MTNQPDLFAAALPLGFTPSPPPPKRGACGRNPKAGAGTCYHWWDGCPNRVSNCYMRWLEANYQAAKDLPREEQIAIAENAESYGWQR